MPTDRYRYCRYKGFKLSIDEDLGNIVKTSTGYMHIGESLDMTCRDRDWFVMDIPKSHLEAIWSISSDKYTYDTLVLEYGQLVVQDCEPLDDNYFNKFIMVGEFASYKNKIYRSISGVNHQIYFKLLSYTPDSQVDGFIMEEPGKFCNQVDPSQIDFAFNSITWCKHQNREFVVVESLNADKIRIQPWSRDTYTQKELSDLGFDNFSKWIKPFEVESIWIKTEKIHDFEKFKNQDRILL